MTSISALAFIRNLPAKLKFAPDIIEDIKSANTLLLARPGIESHNLGFICICVPNFAGCTPCSCLEDQVLYLAHHTPLFCRDIWTGHDPKQWLECFDQPFISEFVDLIVTDQLDLSGDAPLPTDGKSQDELS